MMGWVIPTPKPEGSMEINNKSREENEMNTEIFVVTKKGENKYFNEVFNFTGTIQECDDFALLNNFGGGVEEYEECDGVCKGDSSVTDCYGDCGETYPSAFIKQIYLRRKNNGYRYTDKSVK